MNESPGVHLLRFNRGKANKSNKDNKSIPVMKTATIYFSCGDRCCLSFTDKIHYNTLRGAKRAFKNAIARNFINAAAIYGNFARCTAEAVEDCGNTILKASFAAGYFA